MFIAAVIVILLSLLQGIFFSLRIDSGAFYWGAASLAFISLLAAAAYLWKRNLAYFVVTLILAYSQFCVLIDWFLRYFVPDNRLLLIAIVLVYGGCGLTLLLILSRLFEWRKATLFSFSLATALFLSDVFLGSFTSTVAGNAMRAPQWVGMIDHPALLGTAYHPYSILKAYYPDNPRGYFTKEDPRLSVWWMRTGGGSLGKLEFPDESNTVRILIDKVNTRNGYDVQANLSHFQVVAGQSYNIRFRGRTERARNIVVGCARSHEDWSNLGFYRTVALNNNWQDFQFEFKANAGDENARIHFDVGDNDYPVEISNVAVRDWNGKLLAPKIPPAKYYISYRFNALGCRGPDYAIPKGPETVRILLLGDSYTLGAGVRESDTFGSKLEQLLNKSASSSKHYELINCGVSGYGTREERLLYETRVKKYQPDIVLLSIVTNDDMSFQEEVRKGYSNRDVGKLEEVSCVWARVQNYHHRRPFPDFEKCINEIRRLQDDIQKENARLAVVIFRDDPDFKGVTEVGKAWNQLNHLVPSAVAGSNVPVLDVGPALFQNHKRDDLMVHDIDAHPNEIAHEIAAHQIFRFLHETRLVVE